MTAARPLAAAESGPVISAPPAQRSRRVRSTWRSRYHEREAQASLSCCPASTGEHVRPIHRLDPALFRRPIFAGSKSAMQSRIATSGARSSSSPEQSSKGGSQDPPFVRAQHSVPVRRQTEDRGLSWAGCEVKRVSEAVTSRCATPRRCWPWRGRSLLRLKRAAACRVRASLLPL